MKNFNREKSSIAIFLYYKNIAIDDFLTKKCFFNKAKKIKKIYCLFYVLKKLKNSVYQDVNRKFHYAEKCRIRHFSTIK